MIKKNFFSQTVFSFVVYIAQLENSRILDFNMTQKNTIQFSPGLILV